MDLSSINTIEDLKKLGNFKVVKKEISSLLGFSISAKSWNELFEKIEKIKKVFCNSSNSDTKVIDRNQQTRFFIDEIHELAFYILRHKQGFFDKELNISRKHYLNKEEAKKWRNEMVKKFHPDRVKFDFAEDVTAKINKIYKQMVGK